MILYINGIIYRVINPLRFLQYFFRWLLGRIPQFYVIALFDTDYLKYLTHLERSGDYLTGNLGPKIIRRSCYKKLGPAYQANIKRTVTCTPVVFIMPYIIRMCDPDPSVKHSEKQVEPHFRNRPKESREPFDEEDDDLKETITDFKRLLDHFELPAELTTVPAKRVTRLLRKASRSVSKEPVEDNLENSESDAIFNISWFKTHFILVQSEEKRLEKLLGKLRGKESSIDPYPFVKLSSDLYTDLFFWKYNTKKILKKCPPVTEFSRFCILSRNRIFQQFPNTKKDISLFWIIARRQWDVLSNSEKSNRKFIASKPYQPYADYDELKRFLVYSSEDSDAQGDFEEMCLDAGSANWKGVGSKGRLDPLPKERRGSHEVQLTEKLPHMLEADTIAENSSELPENESKARNSIVDKSAQNITVSTSPCSENDEMRSEIGSEPLVAKAPEPDSGRKKDVETTAKNINTSSTTVVVDEDFSVGEEAERTILHNQTDDVETEKDNKQATAYEVRSPSTIVQTPQTTPPRAGDIESVLASDLKNMGTGSDLEFGGGSRKSNISRDFEDMGETPDDEHQSSIYQNQLVAEVKEHELASTNIHNDDIHTSPLLGGRKNSIINGVDDLQLNIQLPSGNSSETEEDRGFEAEDDEPSRVVSFDNSLETGTSSPTVESVKSLPMVKLRKVQKQGTGRVLSTNLDVNELLHEADEASSVPEKVDKYEKIINTILGPSNGRKRSSTFINALSGWVSAEDGYDMEHNPVPKSKSGCPKRQRSLNLMESLDPATLEKLYQEKK
ncbi:hypothetical protein HII12_002839 [Brettanomyces bruxellensis]|uniref:Uncharacterized protein n=1 Tax=Dekkera bruxellensis TaxID=5007 RepID=A0A8H6EU92_DEKBR|nr:hypothetical protein HII12_002839 [Brettanomyces bruxellensis]